MNTVGQSTKHFPIVSVTSPKILSWAFILFSFFFFSAFLRPGLVFAHGGFVQVVGNTIVVLNQNPISPLVGENVDMNFALVDKNFKPLPNLKVRLDLIETAFNNAAQDQ